LDRIISTPSGRGIARDGATARSITRSRAQPRSGPREISVPTARCTRTCTSQGCPDSSASFGRCAMVAPTPPLALDRLKQSGASPDWAQSPRGDPKLVPVDMLMKARRGAETLPECRSTTRAPSQFLDLAQSGEDIAAAARAGVVKRSKVSRSDRSIARRRSDPRERPTPRPGRPAQHQSTPPPRAQHHAPVGRARPPDPRAGAVEQARPRPPAGAADPPQAPGRRDERRRRRVNCLTN
jgi:hypothetical protein